MLRCSRLTKAPIWGKKYFRSIFKKGKLISTPHYRDQSKLTLTPRGGVGGSLPGGTTSIGNKRPFCVEKEALFLLGTQPRRKLYSAERRGGTEQRPRPQVSKGEVPSRGPAHTVSSTSCRQEHPSVESCPLVIFPPTSAAEVTLPCVTKDQTLPALVISADI